LLAASAAVAPPETEVKKQAPSQALQRMEKDLPVVERERTLRRYPKQASQQFGERSAGSGVANIS
jgi:hypothetical protein